ncbi:FAD-dependent oxidoreductase [Brevibacillus humidisoli]|uniref:NAD(P)/FAD-dependent oxidoreductase n=1 Tax=Brevibacillus humidisoli TaxID=2895522 RepID=UPI001E2D7808|nr:FAD-dependent oxidoreductase [Brevibacillus humidisoli]UFJ39564.1 FAD-dependent oxidoreductase [Brevibacillus humidisoli]
MSSKSLPDTADVLIVGAGPAGLSAAITCAEHGLGVIAVDEYVKPGGRLLGQLHQEPDGHWWNGITEAERLLDQAAHLGVSIVCGVSVYHVERIGEEWLVSTSEGAVRAAALLLATGATETGAPIPGWTLPGVMSIGAAQVMTNVQRVRVGHRGVVIGLNILSMAITRELQVAGIDVNRVVLPVASPINHKASHPQLVLESLLQAAHLAPSPFIRWGSRCLTTDWLKRLAVRCYPRRGVSMWGIPVQLRTAAAEIVGQEKVEAVRLIDVSPDGLPLPGSEREVACDFVCIAGGLSPLAELAAVAGCPFAYVPELGGHVPLHNERMQTPLKGLYVAGNITGIESAKVAMAQGTVAGLSIADERGRLGEPAKLQQAVQHVTEVRRQAIIQFHPAIEQGRSTVVQLFEKHLAGSASAEHVQQQKEA